MATKLYDVDDDFPPFLVPIEPVPLSNNAMAPSINIKKIPVTIITGFLGIIHNDVQYQYLTILIISVEGWVRCIYIVCIAYGNHYGDSRHILIIIIIIYMYCCVHVYCCMYM